ncbi:glycosyltransferase family 4 protein [Euhalothece natronophila Z-M001]|uniref:Glycosyltransferase family 4 protein n=1 Tax=Euhalothece natronophila Z-M001 TaxID=522448 RepID=A0A5B8NL72_9CHRO|nr:glycosyltransferase family 4 protein [Euhalothece natronophila]QDZ39657.1 glycosyltransferase family 4 protein [Euhalothece natronophila Z-M001]
MHIAWLGKKSPFCGNVTYSRTITNALIERGYDVSFLHFTQGEADSQEWPDFTEVFLPCLYKSQVYTIPTLGSSHRLRQSLEKLKPDLVHASLTLSPLDFRLPEICRSLNIPLVATFHPAFDKKLRNLKSSTQLLTYQLYAPFLAHYDRVIVFSRLQRDLLVRLGVPEETLAVIPNGIDESKYSPGQSNFKESIGAERLFVYQGRVSTEKNVESLLKAWKHCELGETSKLVIVGDGPLVSSLKPFYNKRHGVIWFGFVANEEKRIEILRAADVFILPSLVEGLSLSLLEGMGCGIACVATDAGADGEVLEDGAGVVLKTNRVTAQLKTLLPVLEEHPELTKLLGEKARARVLDRYTLQNNISQLEILYQEAIKSYQESLMNRN